jgi:hypothetical protein
MSFLYPWKERYRPLLEIAKEFDNLDLLMGLNIR